MYLSSVEDPSVHLSTIKDLLADHGRPTLLHCLLYWERRQPNAIFLTQPLGDGRVAHYTWRDVAEQVRRMAFYLKTLDLPPRSHVAIYGKNSAHWIMADLAIWMAGFVSVPLYPTLNAETAEYVLAHSEAKLLFIGKLDGQGDSWNQVNNIIPRGLPCVRLPLAPAYEAPQWQDLIKDTPPLQPAALPRPDDLATILYTSGSTGLPKGVMHSFATMLAPAQGMNSLYEVTNQDRLLSYLPLAHAAERVFVETVALYFGCRVFFAGTVATFLQDLRRARPTIFLSVPRLWTKFYQGINEKFSPQGQKVLFRLPLLNRVVKKKILTELGLKHVRVAITGSAPLPANILSWYRRLGLELLEAYAMSENFGYSHVTRPGDVRIGYVGRANPGVECRIDANGEVLVKSPGTMLGYYKHPEKTAEDLTADGFLRTGDMGELDGDGRLKITGRVKDLFKTAKGKYVAPVPIEQQLGNHPAIETVCVCGANRPQPVALVLPAEELRADLIRGQGRAALERELAALLADTNAALEPHERLDFLVVILDPWTMDNGLLTPTLKIRRNRVEARYDAVLETWGRQRRQVVWQ